MGICADLESSKNFRIFMKLLRAMHTESDTFNFIARKWNDAPGRMQSRILRDEKKRGTTEKTGKKFPASL